MVEPSNTDPLYGEIDPPYRVAGELRTGGAINAQGGGGTPAGADVLGLGGGVLLGIGGGDVLGIGGS